MVNEDDSIIEPIGFNPKTKAWMVKINKNTLVRRQIEAKVEEKINKIKRILKQTLDPGNYAFLQILKIFNDEKPHSWTEIRENADVSKLTLNKKLKELTKKHILKREVIVSFPPRTQYSLNKKGVTPIVYKRLITLGKIIENYETIVRILFHRFYLLNLMKQINIKEADVEQEIKRFMSDILFELKEEVHRPLSSFHESWHGLLATHKAYVIMFISLALSEALSINPIIKEFTENFLETTLIALKKEVKEPRKEVSIQ